MYSGLMYAVSSEGYHQWDVGSLTVKWERYPTLPNDRLVDSVSIDDEKMFAVTKDHKLFVFSTYNSLSKADQAKYKKGLFMQKMMNPTKQRDGSRVT